MKKAGVVFAALMFFVCGVAQGLAQEKSMIAVRGSGLNSGIVVLDVHKAGKDYHLQCNQGAPSCVQLKNGDYLMVELPKNFGMYECRDVEVYPAVSAVPGGNPSTKDKLGEYCLVEK